ncbi:MAG: hypothetical protein Tsb0027_11800 [Wenzhouxiangellaceae bacterium]
MNKAVGVIAIVDVIEEIVHMFRCHPIEQSDLEITQRCFHGNDGGIDANSARHQNQKQRDLAAAGMSKCGQ